jgi:hypothetical protein
MALTGISTAALGREPPEIPSQDDMAINVVSDHMVLNGLNVAAYELHSARSVDEVAEFYKAAWHEDVAVRDVEVGLNSMPWKVLAHRQGSYLVTVQLQPADASGRGSYGLIAVSDAFDSDGHAPAVSDIPMPGDSTVVSDATATDMNRRSRTVVLQNQDSAQYNVDFYRQRLTDSGWVEVSRPKYESQTWMPPQALLMNRGSDELNLAVDRSGNTSTVVIVTVDR